MDPEKVYNTLEKILVGNRKFRSGPLGPMDFANVDAWLNAGIPPQAVIDGVLKTLASFKPSKFAPVIRSCGYFADEIYRAAEESSVERHWERKKLAHSAQDAPREGEAAPGNVGFLSFPLRPALRPSRSKAGIAGGRT